MPGRLRSRLSIHLTVAVATAALTVVASATPAAAAVRYKDLMFPGTPTVQSNLVYGSAPDVNGVPTTLRLDLYQPAGDAATDRAAIMWVHGGGFSGGSKTNTNSVGYARWFAQRGYVTASIDYRLRPGLTCDFHNVSAECYAAALDAQHDAQASVRWLRANASTYGVDPNRIIIAGNSVGAMTAMNVNYNSENTGSSGTPGQASTVSAGVSLAGCALPPSTIGPGEPPTILIHAKQDPKVPFSCPTATYNAAIAAGNVSKLVGKTSSNHGLTSDVSTFAPAVANFLYNRVIAPSSSLPSVSVSDVSLTEGNSATKSATFTVSLSAASSGTVTVAYGTADGSATAPSDYAAKSGSLTFSPGQTSKSVTVSVVGDTAVEPDETFTLNLSNPSGATLGDASGTGTIRNDDGAAGRTLSITDVTRVEGASGTKTGFVFKVKLSSASSSPVTVTLSTANGTATAGSDYTAKTKTVSIPAGTTTVNVSVRVLGDGTPEPNETFTFNLSGAIGATIADGQGVGTITNDD